MALRAYEVLLIARAQNQASGVLRSVGRDILALGKAARVASSAQTAMGQAMVQRQGALRNISAMEKDLTSLQRQRATITARQAVLDNAVTSGFTQRQRVLRTLGDLQLRHAAAATKVAAAEERVKKAVSDRAKFTGGMSAMSAADRTVARSQLPGYAAGIAAANSELTKMQGKLKGVEQGTHIANRQWAQTSGTVRRNARELGGLRASLVGLSAAEGHAATQIAQTKGQLASLDKQIATHEATIQRAMRSAARWEKLSRVGAVMRDSGRALRLFGIAGAAGFGMAAKAAADFNTQASLAATQTGLVGTDARTVAANTKIISKDILDQMKQFPAASEEMAKATYEIFSSTDLGVQSVSRGMTLLTLFNKAAVAGMTDLTTVADAGVSVMNAFGKQPEQMEPIMQRLFAAVRFGRMTFADFTGTLSQIAPAFAGAGQNADQMAGSMAFLSRLMPSTRMAAASLARMMEMISRPKFITGMKAFGVNIATSTGKLKPLNEVMDLLAKRFPELEKGGVSLSNLYKTITAAGAKSDELKKVLAQPDLVADLNEFGIKVKDTHGRLRPFPKILEEVTNALAGMEKPNATLKKVQKTLLGVAGSLEGTVQGRRALTFFMLYPKVFQTIFDQVLRDNNEFTRSFDAQNQTAGVRWARFMNRLRSDFIRIGQDAIPAIIEATKPIQRLIDWFEGLDQSARRNLVTWGVWGSAIALAGGMLLALVGGIINLLALMGRFGIIGRVAIAAFAGITLGAHRGGQAVDYLSAGIRELLTLLGRGVSGFFDFAGSSMGNFALAAGVAAIAAAKITRSIKAARAVSAGTAAAGGAGMLPMVFGTPGGIRNYMGNLRTAFGTGMILSKTKAGVAPVKILESATKKAGMFRRMMALTASSALLLPGPLKIAVPLIAAGAGFAYLWHKRQQGIREETERIKQSQDAFREFVSAPKRAALAFSSLAVNMGEFTARRTDLVLINDEIRRMQQAMKKEKGPDRAASEARLTQMYLQRAGIMKMLDQEQTKINKSAAAFNTSIVGQTRDLAFLGVKETKLQQLQGRRKQILASVAKAQAYADRTGRQAGFALLEIEKQKLIANAKAIESTRRTMANTRQEILAGANTLRTSFKNMMLDLSKMKLIPKVDTKMIDRTLQALVKLPALRMKFVDAPLPVLKALVEAQLDPKSIAKLPKDLQRLVRQFMREIVIPARIEVRKRAALLQDLKELGVKITPKIEKLTIPQLQEAVRDAQRRVSVVFKTKLEKPPNIKPFAESINRQIREGAEIIPKLPTKGIFGTVNIPSKALPPANADKVKTDLEKKFTPAIRQAIRVADGGSGKALRGQLERLFFPTINQSINISQVRRISTIVDTSGGGDRAGGSDAVAGVAQGVSGNANAVSDAMVSTLQSATKAATDYLQATSPSKLYAVKIGQPMIEGILLGLARKRGELQKEAVLDIALFEGPWLTALQDQQSDMQVALFQTKALQDKLSALEDKAKFRKAVFSLHDRIAGIVGKKKTTDRDIKKLAEYQKQLAELNKKGKALTGADLIRDMGAQARTVEQLDRAFATLSRKNVPREFLAQLAAMGQEGARIMQVLAGMNNRQINRIVADWKRAEAAADSLNKKINKITIKDLTKDLRDSTKEIKMFNQDMKLLSKLLPKEVMDELAAGGIETADKIHLIAQAARYAKKDFAEWKKEAIANGVAQANSARITKEAYDAAIKASKEAIREGMRSLVTETRAAMREWMGDIFAGIAAIRQARAEAAQAMSGAISMPNVFSGLDEYMQNRQQMVEEHRQQSEDLEQQAKATADALAQYNKEIADRTKQAVDDMRGSMGTLTQGPWMQWFGEWGSSMRMLQRDLRLQVDTFKRWRADLAALSARGLPVELLKQLRDLGPEATRHLDALVKATDAELAEYIKTWQEGEAAVNKAAMQELDLSDVVLQISDALGGVSSSIQELIPTMADLTAVLEGNMKGFGQWIDDLQTLIDRGLPADLVQQLLEAGPAGAAAVRALASATGPELAKFITIWNNGMAKMKTFQQQFTEKKMTIEEINTVLREQIDRFNKWRGSLTSVFQALRGAGVPAQQALLILKQLEALGPDAQPLLESLLSDPGNNAALKEFANLWKVAEAAIEAETKLTIGRQLKLWETYGKDAAAAFLAGVVQEEAKLVEYFSNMLWNMIKKATAAAKKGGKQKQTPLGRGGGGDMMEQAAGDVAAAEGIFDFLVTTIEPQILQLTTSLQGAAVKWNTAIQSHVGVMQNVLIPSWTTTRTAFDSSIKPIGQLGSDAFKKITDSPLLMQQSDKKSHWNLLVNSIRILGDNADQAYDQVMNLKDSLTLLDGTTARTTIIQTIKTVREGETGGDTSTNTNTNNNTGNTGNIGTGTRPPGGRPYGADAFMRAGSLGTTVNMTVEAHQDESLMTTMERASFRLRNRT